MVDNLIQFEFSPPHTHEAIFVHQSRLEFVGGPMKALVTQDFKEKVLQKVSLSAEDDPETFAIIKDYLYCKNIGLFGKPVPLLVTVIRSAHRWELSDLFQAICRYVVQYDVLSDLRLASCLADVILFPDVPVMLKEYFWLRVAQYFDQSAPPEFRNNNLPTRLGNCTESDENVDTIMKTLSPSFPQIWNLAIADRALPTLIQRILETTSRDINEALLRLILQHLEPRIQDDAVLLNLLNMVLMDSGPCHDLLNKSYVDRLWSARAVRLFSRSLRFPHLSWGGMSFSFRERNWLNLNGTGPCSQSSFTLCLPKHGFISPNVYISVTAQIKRAKDLEVVLFLSWKMDSGVDTSFSKQSLDVRVYLQEDQGIGGDRCKAWHLKNLFSLRSQGEFRSAGIQSSKAMSRSACQSYVRRHASRCFCMIHMHLNVAVTNT